MAGCQMVQGQCKMVSSMDYKIMGKECQKQLIVCPSTCTFAKQYINIFSQITATEEGHLPPALSPSWEEQRHVSDDRLNFRQLSASMDRLDLEINVPRDR